MSRAVTQMDQVVQGNAEHTEELSATARALAEQAERLLALVGRFHLSGETSQRAIDDPPRAAAAQVDSPAASMPRSARALSASGSARAG